MLKKFFAKYAVILLLVLVVAQIAVSVAYSNFGETIRDLEERNSALVLDNQRFSAQLAKFESLNIVASRAGELGFQSPQVLYLTPQAPVAAKLNGETN